jgi:hypothetical protein
MKLKLISNYSSREVRFDAGVEIEVSDAQAAFLMADAPGCFAVVGPEVVEVKDFDAPPVDKMIHKAKVKK